MVYKGWRSLIFSSYPLFNYNRNFYTKISKLSYMLSEAQKQFNRIHSLNSIFNPKSVAVIGASNDIKKIGGYIFSELKKIEGADLYPINLKEKVIQERIVYSSLRAIGTTVDLVIIAIPAQFVIDSIKDAIQANCKNIIIISAGFKETGEKGKERENLLKQYIQKYDLNVIGPNCLGILNPNYKLNASFAKDIPTSGEIALVSQSGAIIDAIIDWSFKHKIGFSKIVSMGNMAGISELEMLQFLKSDPKTKAIVFYIETLNTGKEFANLVKEISRHKPVIIIKPGTSKAAKAAIGSHTGSLAQDNLLVKTLILNSNGILVENLNELFNVLIGLKGKINEFDDLTIVTNAGGLGVIATDEVEESDFKIKQFSEKEKLEFNFLPLEASKNNPIDMLGDAKSDRYIATLNHLISKNDVNNILVLLTPQIMTDSLNIAKNLLELSQKTNKNIFSCFLGEKEVKSAKQLLDMYNFPNFETPGEAITAMNKLLIHKKYDYHSHAPHYKLDDYMILQCRNKLKNKTGLLDFFLTKEILKVFSIHLPSKKVLTKIQDINRIELEKNKKYVMKIDGMNMIHKKENGGIVFGIDQNNFGNKVRDLYNKFNPQHHSMTITIEEEVEGTEVIVGLKRDPQLGPFIMFGMGGTYVNVLKDVHFASCPISKKEAEKLILSSKVYTLLKGFRGSKPANFPHLIEVLVRISQLMNVFPEIKEVDLNPIICNEKGVFLVDVKVIL